MDVVAPVVSTPISCKNMLTGSTHLHPSENIVNLDGDVIELLDDDVIIGLFDGVPTIDFSDRVQYLAIKSMELTLVVKILGRRISYNTLQNHIYNIWMLSYPIKLIYIKNDFFLVKFSNRGDYLKVLTEGPWTIFGHYITMEPWSTDFNPLQASASRVMAWVRLPGLPTTLFKRSFIESIGNQIGSVIKMDFQTDNGCRDICPKLHAQDDPEPMQKENDVQSSPIHDNPAPADPFDPWMLVELNMLISPQSLEDPRNLLLAPIPLSSHPPAVSVLQQDTLPVVPSSPLPTATKATRKFVVASNKGIIWYAPRKHNVRRTEATSSKVLRPRGISKSSTKSLLDRLKHLP
ncbi:hypothetical protein GQ457_08G032330 [Hibiscus cannabinus]